jgi:CheY-like chemotaxis protein
MRGTAALPRRYDLPDAPRCRFSGRAAPRPVQIAAPDRSHRAHSIDSEGTSAKVDRVDATRSDEPRLQGLTILVVEDHHDSRELVTQLLLLEGAIVLTAHDAAAALTTLEARIPDVIVTDVLMPGMDGLAFARRVKADPRWTQVPIIALTALGGAADVRDTFEAGCAAHVKKPIDWELLFRTIERALASARPLSPQPQRRRA